MHLRLHLKKRLSWNPKNRRMPPATSKSKKANPRRCRTRTKWLIRAAELESKALARIRINPRCLTSIHTVKVKRKFVNLRIRKVPD